MKTIQFLFMTVLLQACKVTIDGETATVTDPVPVETTPKTDTDAKAEDPKPDDGEAKSVTAAPADPAPAPVVTTPGSFCVVHELRSGYAVPIPLQGALYAALVHDGVLGREADPKCYLAKAVVKDGRRHVPCGVTLVGTPFGAGPFYNHMWSHVDRIWIKGAFEREQELASLTANEMSVTVETVAAGSAFSADATLIGQELVDVSLDSAVNFSGYCQ